MARLLGLTFTTSLACLLRGPHAAASPVFQVVAARLSLGGWHAALAQHAPPGGGEGGGGLTRQCRADE